MISSRQIVSYIEWNILFTLSTLSLTSGGFRELKVKQKVVLMLCYILTVGVSTDFVGISEFILHELKI